MIPSIDTRLSSMISAMTQVVGPAVAGNPFAAEQAALVTAHLQVMRAEEPRAQEFERLDYNRLRSYAARLAAVAEGGTAVDDASRRIRDTLSRDVPFTILEVRAAHDDLAGAVGALIEAAGSDGTAQFVDESQTIVLAEERANAVRHRSYFKLMGYETGVVEIPDPDAMLTDFREAQDVARGGTA